MSQSVATDVTDDYLDGDMDEDIHSDVAKHGKQKILDYVNQVRAVHGDQSVGVIHYINKLTHSDLRRPNRRPTREIRSESRFLGCQCRWSLGN